MNDSPVQKSRSWPSSDQRHRRQWGIGGWLLPYHLTRIGPDETQKLRERVAQEITTTFANSYTREISLAEALEPQVINRYGRTATGEKYLIRPYTD